MGFAHGLFFKKQRSSESLHTGFRRPFIFRGHSPRYQLNTVGIPFFSIVFPLMWRRLCPQTEFTDAQGRLKTQNLQSVLTSGSLR
ncbi:hypothetical protein NEISICOT_03112 [Neisseria sicca ATCC 29256]|uniref:Uncharacterized protein n=1 Tax=Neisseria sicca ATCC 29256 TaxID=547045 RepID=C6M987_NEISI|nr:hypothetical protein NEISICOT_03112 [Neisseria sicca ATCC 29256]